MDLLNPATIVKFIKFGLVGCSGVLIDFGLTYLVKEKLRWNKYLASSLGFCFAASSNFILNRNWTFQSDDPQITAQYFKFMLIAAVGVSLSNAILWVLSERFKIKFYTAKALATLIVMVWNFLANSFITFQ